MSESCSLSPECARAKHSFEAQDRVRPDSENKSRIDKISMKALKDALEIGRAGRAGGGAHL